MTRRRFLELASGTGAAVGAAVLLGGCSGGSSGPGGGPPRSSFPIGAAKASKSKPVRISFWHSMSNQNLKV
ncbi:MAG TPA: hypothetical protein VGS21_03350, partial [Acidimicrobiales bacterium]|nr:hypothetical protein [Acidimicrobiales bacterium]